MLTKKGPFADAGGITESAVEESIFPPYLFKHQDLTRPPKSAGRINQKKLINTVNHIHFTGEQIWVHLKDPRYEEDIFVSAHLEPCTGETITCQWSKENATSFEHHRFLNLLIDDGLSVMLVPAKLLNVNMDRFTIQIPDISYVLGKRQARRYTCHKVTAELNQNGFLASGDLLDFSPLSFRIKVIPDYGGSFHWLNPDEPVMINLYKNQRLIYSGHCRIVYQTDNMSVKEIVVASLSKQVNRFRKKKIRGQRMQLAPTSSITFEHPFSGKKIRRDIYDISVTGFSVRENNDDGVLVPGMIIPRLNINYYSDMLKMTCTAQVINRRETGNKIIHCGLAILDMDIDTYGMLSNLLNIIDPHVYVSSEIDMDALWKFFFETGFIYPQKYDSIQSYSEHFKETYRKLYKARPEIATHVTYQKNGQVYGHVSMVRAYERAWMVHHLAARPIPGISRHTGLNVLKQLLNYFDGIYRLPSVKMDYMLFYFRPENKFPDLFFGGFARNLKNLSACSMDLFAYKSYQTGSTQNPLPDGWLLREYSATDSWELEQFYRNRSGGLLLNVLCPEYEHSDDKTLEEAYKRHGLIRKTKIHSLIHMQKLKAVLVVNQSDLGLNLSELLNGIKVIITDPSSLPWNVLSMVLDRLTDIYKVDNIPVLIYPHTYFEDNNVPYDKQYQLWIMDTQYGDHYLEYMRDKTRMKLQYIFKFLIGKYMKK
ncbi:MAG: PilZ domain-containing protein [Syntrophobacterales bacterium]|nr:PilZ domain-containing protein [Syntrophobacterales bacterium]